MDKKLKSTKYGILPSRGHPIYGLIITNAKMYWKSILNHQTYFCHTLSVFYLVSALVQTNNVARLLCQEAQTVNSSQIMTTKCCI